MNPNLIPDGPLLAAAVEKLLKYQASVDQTLQPSINQQLGGQSRFFMARGVNSHHFAALPTLFIFGPISQMKAIPLKQ